MLVNDGLVFEQERNDLGGGTQRLYRWGKYGLSLINSPMAHSYPFAWEAAVIEYAGDEFHLHYDTGLLDDVEVFSSDDETNVFIAKAAKHFKHFQNYGG